MRKIILYILGIIALASLFLATGVKETENWLDIARPLFAIYVACVVIGILVYNINYIRRITYPTLVCLSAWSYKHKVLMTRFTRNTYRIYKAKNRSYKRLFNYTKNLFDIYIEGLERH